MSENDALSLGEEFLARSGAERAEIANLFWRK